MYNVLNVRLVSALPVYVGVALMAYSSHGLYGAGLSLLLVHLLRAVVLAILEELGKKKGEK